MITKLVFVYNATSGAINSSLDSAHKIISPGTYDCKLCNLTYGVFKENEEWSRFLEEFRFRESEIQKKPMLNSMRYESINNISLEFLHKNQFNKKYWSKWLPKYDFPIILSADESNMYNDGFGSNGGLDIFMSAADFKGLASTTDLIEAIKERL